MSETAGLRASLSADSDPPQKLWLFSTGMEINFLRNVERQHKAEVMPLSLMDGADR